MPLRVDIPVRVMKPIIDATESGWPAIQSADQCGDVISIVGGFVAGIGLVAQAVASLIDSNGREASRQRPHQRRKDS